MQDEEDERNRQLLRQARANARLLPQKAPPDKPFMPGYERAIKEHPTAKLAADLLPVTGQATALVDTARALNKGQYGHAGLAALGLLPGEKAFVKGAEKLGLVPKAVPSFVREAEGAAAEEVGKLWPTSSQLIREAREKQIGKARNAAEKVDFGQHVREWAESEAEGHKRGGTVKKKTNKNLKNKSVNKSVSKASKRADGICQRGKTKGRLV